MTATSRENKGRHGRFLPTREASPPPAPTASRKRAETALLVTLATCAAATFAASAAIQTTGYALWHDELWNHPAAVSLLRGKSWQPAWEVSILGLPLPLVSGPYQGSIKTFALVPFLAALGTSPGVLRGVHCAFGMLYLAALYWALRGVLSRRAAAWVFLLPLADPNLTMFVPSDMGPFLLQNTFLAVALGALLRLEQYPRRRWLLLALGGASMALADKLTSAPVVAVVVILALARGVRTLGWSAPRWGLAAAVACLPMLPHAAYFARAGFAELEANVGGGLAQRSPYTDRLRNRFREFNGFIAAGSHIPQALTSEPVPRHRPLLVPLGLLLGVLGGLAASARPREGRATGVSALALPLSFAAFAAVPGLERPWHYLVLHPPLVISAFLGFACLAELARGRRGLAPALPAALTLLVAGAGAVGMARSMELLSFVAARRGAHMYSPGLYHLHQELASLAPQRLVCLNYSLCNPLYVLTSGRVEVIDLTWAEPGEGTVSYARSLSATPGTVMVYRSVSGAAGPTQASYFDWLNRTSDYLLPRLADDPELTRRIVYWDQRAEFGVLSATPLP